MLLQSTQEELKKIMMSVEIKYRYLGEKQDTPESRFAADRYISAKDQNDSFLSYSTYTIEAIMNSGLTRDEAVAAEYALSPTMIPIEFRDNVLSEQRRIIIRDYEEMNSYFRLLNGMPPEGEAPMYADVSFYEENSIEFKALHEFSDTEIMLLESKGLLNRIREAFPHVKHLNYIGSKRIDPYYSRRAANFQIIRVDYTGDRDLLEKFLTVYEQCREYTMNVLYVNDFSSTEPYYDRFMALMTMIMAVQRTLVTLLKGAISREYFDVQLIKTLFDSYGVPFIESLPIEYQKLIAKNLDKLLHLKSTDRVIFDIAEILGFSNASIFKYYLVKNHRMDEDGNPIFDYIENDQGVLVPNYEAMYDVYFQTVDIKEKNEEFALADSGNRQEYNEVVVDDAYWWDGEDELLQTLYENEFNYIETKYMHMNVMIKITKMLFEIIHVFRLLQDKKEQSERLEIGLPKIIPNRKISLFTYTVFMAAAIAKKNKLKGEIITAPSKTLYVLGFDFGNDLLVIKDTLHKYEKIIDTTRIHEWLRNMEMLNAKDVDHIFHNIEELWVFLRESLANAKTIEEYKAYNVIYRALHVTQDMQDIFTKSDGTVAETYLDMLGDLDMQLKIMVETADEEDIFLYINHGIDSIENVIRDTEYLYAITDTSATMIEALKKMITFFKSYTVDLKEFNVIYVLDDKYLHGIKLISQITSMEADVEIHDTRFKNIMLDIIHISSQMHVEDFFKIIREVTIIDVDFTIKEKILLAMKAALGVNLQIVDKQTMYDVIESCVSMSKNDEFSMKDSHNVAIDIGNIDNIKMVDSHKVGVDLNVLSSTRMDDNVTHQSIKSDMDRIELRTKKDAVVELSKSSNLPMTDSNVLKKLLGSASRTDMIDTVNLNFSIQASPSVMRMKDEIRIIRD